MFMNLIDGSAWMQVKTGKGVFLVALQKTG
jgi:hypothetical protein